MTIESTVPIAWKINHTSLSLHHKNGCITLDAKQYALLMLFQHNSKKNITKEQIFDSLWQDKIVSEDAIYVAINNLRKTLGDDPKHPCYIKTVSGVGYRWIGPEFKRHTRLGYKSTHLAIAVSFLFIGFGILLFKPSSEKQSIPSDLIEPFNHARFIIENQHDALPTAIEMLKDIVLIHPELTEPTLWLAKAYLSQPIAEQHSQFNQFDKAETLLKRVLVTQPDHQEANLQLAKLTFMTRLNVKEAEQYFINSLPHPEGHHLYGQYLLAVGRFEEAMAQIKQYQILLPDAYSSESVAWTYYMSQQYELALNELEKLYSYNSDSVFYHVCLGAIYTKLGNKLGAFNALVEVMKHRGYTANDITHLTELYKQSGIEAVYEWLLYQDTLRADLGHYSGAMAQARYATVLGKNELAIQYLKQAAQEGRYEVLWIASDPHYSTLWELVEFKKLAAELNLIN